METGTLYPNISNEVRKDIAELEQKIDAFKKGDMVEDKFKHYRLTRGVYGQRQLGVHMFRTKIPYGKLNSKQLKKVAEISRTITNGNLHLTTRQNIQLHHVKLDDSPKVWRELADVGMTAREACGNTVRNVTASAKAGVDPKEPFDVSPYAQAVFEYFLRNPICQDMGRKIKPAFSSSEEDAAFTFIHDFGFIPKYQTIGDTKLRGFKVVVGGGLGAQAVMAKTAFEFLEEDRIIPFMEAALRVFDRYGERSRRHKARMKFLINTIGLEAFLGLVEQERKALKEQVVPINSDIDDWNENQLHEGEAPEAQVDEAEFDRWLKTNTFEQKQKGFYAIQIKVLLGDISSDTAEALADLVANWAKDDIRITINQGFLIRFVRKQWLKYWFSELKKLGLADDGFDSTADITACPGTDTCNLGVTNSTAISVELERLIRQDFPQLLLNDDIKIKISGCMNSCGQHMIAAIGYHGSSIRVGQLVAPAMQVVMGGGLKKDGTGLIAEKVIKLPTKRIPASLKLTLNDYFENKVEGQTFSDYYYQQGKRYFYDLLKPLADKESLGEDDFIDWGENAAYKQAIGVGECAGVSYDMVATILNEAKEKVELAKEAELEGSFADSAYQYYGAFVIAAKALLLSIDVKCNTHIGIVKDFDEHFVQSGLLAIDRNFEELVLSIRQSEPGKQFVETYGSKAREFVKLAEVFRNEQLKENEETLVIDNYYKA